MDAPSCNQFSLPQSVEEKPVLTANESKAPTVPQATTPTPLTCLACYTAFVPPLHAHPAWLIHCSACTNNRYYSGGVASFVPSESSALPAVAIRPRDLLACAPSALAQEHIHATCNREFFQQVRTIVLLVHTSGQLTTYLLNPSARQRISVKLPTITTMLAAKAALQKDMSLLFHFVFDKEYLILPAVSVESSNIHLVLSAYDSPPSKMNPHRLTVELFVDVNLWGIFSIEDRYSLKYLQVLIEDYVTSSWPDRRLSDKHDCMAVVLYAQDTIVELGGLCFVHRRWYFPPGQAPAEALKFYATRPVSRNLLEGLPEGCIPLGVSTILGLFAEEVLQACETLVTDLCSNLSALGASTVDVQRTSNGLIRRLKFFFNSRYSYGAGQQARLQQPSRGMEATADPIPPWVLHLVEATLVQAKLLPIGFINHAAINVYYTLGLLSHMDDAGRFARPIASLRLFSDSRLSFGASGLGMNNPLCFVPMARGSVTILEENSFAADGITHCVRSQDVAGRSAVIILRHVHDHVLKAALS